MRVSVCSLSVFLVVAPIAHELVTVSVGGHAGSARATSSQSRVTATRSRATWVAHANVQPTEIVYDIDHTIHFANRNSVHAQIRCAILTYFGPWSGPAWDCTCLHLLHWQRECLDVVPGDLQSPDSKSIRCPCKTHATVRCSDPMTRSKQQRTIMRRGHVNACTHAHMHTIDVAEHCGESQYQNPE